MQTAPHRFNVPSHLAEAYAAGHIRQALRPVRAADQPPYSAGDELQLHIGLRTPLPTQLATTVITGVFDITIDLPRDFVALSGPMPGADGHAATCTDILSPYQLEGFARASGHATWAAMREQLAASPLFAGQPKWMGHLITWSAP